MQIQKIFFDMDGVLADFDRGVRELCGLKDFGRHGKTKSGSDDDMWEAIRRTDHFYDRLQPISEAMEMFHAIFDKYADRCEILTGIPKPKRQILTAGADKIDWVRRLLSKDITVNIVYKEEKQKFCVGKGCVLIDDFERNIREWEASGGIGILYTNAKDVLRRLKEIEQL